MIRRGRRFIRMGRTPMSFRGNWDEKWEEYYNPSESDYEKLMESWKDIENICDIVNFGIENGFIRISKDDKVLYLSYDKHDGKWLAANGAYALQKRYNKLCFENELGNLLEFNEDDDLTIQYGDIESGDIVTIWDIEDDADWNKLFQAWMSSKLSKGVSTRRERLRKNLKRQVFKMFNEIPGMTCEWDGAYNHFTVTIPLEGSDKYREYVKNICKRIIKKNLSSLPPVPHNDVWTIAEGVEIEVPNYFTEDYSISEIRGFYEDYADVLDTIAGMDFEHIKDIAY